MTSAPLNPSASPARRTVMVAAGAAGLAAALTACGSSDDGSSSSTTTNGNAGGGSTTQDSNGSAGGSTAAAGGSALAKTTDIPEGGGTIYKDQAVVVTQPTSGTYKAFSTKCPHAGCAVTSIANGEIVCPCHGSKFAIADGSVKQGPATTGLTAANITVSGDQISLA
ncbi:Rieske (2Fe-2S) protein [Streptomyces sp. 900105755]|uniref:Rieske (2Fe-2S) protein n=1 Tax=unclassified Streptomyces TaxID=2593676 RepID=UPI00089BCB55|nr:Rieske (2Fe-2S) protein [Streptomyces sp. Ag109_O5-10]SEF14906.1 Ferredoxin subunit of nitrite reductase or a ring-hydroxylating dioxygenase [Streptomyces sp. Ag109_O5-10]